MKTRFKYILALLIIMVFIPSVNAQVVLSELEEILDKMRVNDLLDPTNKNSYAEVEGNPYLFDGTLQNGVITLNTQEKYSGKFRYDIHANQVQFLHKGTYYAIADPASLDNVQIGDYTLVYAMTDVKKGRGSYFVLVVDGKCRLLARKRVILIDAEPRKAYSDPKPACFDRENDTYYILKDFRIAHKVNKKNIQEVLSDQREKIDNYLKENKVSFSSREDLIKLIRYYNSL